MAKKAQAIPKGYHTVTPSLCVAGADRAIEFYKRALGAEEIMRFPAPDGKIMHAEIRIGNSIVMLNDAMMGAKGPKAAGGSPASLWIYVDDADALFNRAVAAGASVANGPMGAVADQFWGDRCGTFTDPHGYRWTIATRKEDLSKEEMDQRQTEWMRQFAAESAKG